MNREQLKRIREDGTFEVSSKNFQGAVHRWRISQLLQKGRHTANEDLKHALARAYYFTCIIARDRIVGDSYSLKDAIKHFGYSLYFVYNLLIGGQLRISKFDRDKALLSALVRGLTTDSVISLTEENRSKIMKQVRTMDILSQRLPLKEAAVPHVYTDCMGNAINVFSVSSCWVRSLDASVRNQIFANACAAAKEKYPPEFVQGLIKEYQEQGMSCEEINKIVRDRFDVDFLNELVIAFKEHPAINDAIPLGQGGVIESFIMGLEAVKVSIDTERSRIEGRVNSRVEQLNRDKSIRSKCPIWMKEQIVKATNAAEVQESTFENIRQSIRSNASIGAEWLYFINICEEFFLDLPRIKREIDALSYSVESELHTMRIWNPRNYIVESTQTGKRKTDVSIQSVCTVCEVYVVKYRLSKYCEHEVTTEYPGWRCRNFFVSSYTWLMNILFVLLLVLVLKGPFSLSGLFLCYEHATEYSIDVNTGNIYVTRRGKTLVTRLVSLWKSIEERRREFESRPDTGFLSKNVTRVLNWCYYNIVWGVLGSIAFSFVFIIICSFVITLGLVLTVTLPIWFLVLRVFLLLVRWLFYDWEYKDPTGSNSRGYIMPLFYLIVYKLFIRVFLQFMYALGVILMMPLLSLLWIAVAIVFRISRFLWDAIMYYSIIKRRGRVPVIDSFVAKRISGPGLATSYYHQIDPAQALIKLEYDLESKELELYYSFMKSLIDMPRRNYVRFLEKILTPFGYSTNHVNDTNETYVEIVKQKAELMQQLETAVKNRRSSYALNIHSVELSSIRMNKEDLKLTITVATEVVEEFYRKRILAYPSQSMFNVFSKHGLVSEDWDTLAKTELEHSFSPQFLSHLQDSDESFHLQVNKFHVHKYFRNLRYGISRHDLDRERLVAVDKSYTFLPGIDLKPRYSESWLLSGCNTTKKQEITKYNPGTNKHEKLLFPSYFSDKMIIFAHVANNAGWDSIINEVANGECDDSAYLQTEDEYYSLKL